MLQQLLDDLRGYFESKPSLTEVEQALLDRLKEDIFPILFLQRDDLAQMGFDVRRISAEQMRRLALRITEDYCQSETSAGENFWEELEEMAEALHLPRCPRCPACDHYRTIFDAQENVLRCEVCDRHGTKSSMYWPSSPTTPPISKRTTSVISASGARTAAPATCRSTITSGIFRKILPGTPIISRCAGRSLSRTSSPTSRTNPSTH